jgi:hypothetical protein
VPHAPLSHVEVPTRRPRARLCLLALVCASASAAPAAERPYDGPLSSADPNQYAIEAGGELFRWQEFDDDGRRLLSEQGPRAFVSGLVHNLTRRDRGLVYAARLRAFGGDVEYDGQDTDHVFVGTDSRYRGWEAMAQAGYRFVSSDGADAIDVMAGLATERWQRDIQRSTNALGSPVAGFIEDYRVDYFRASAGLLHRVRDFDGYLALGLRIPLSVDEEANVDGSPLTLHPGRRVSSFVSYKVSLASTRRGEPFGAYVEAFYAGYRFGKSPTRAGPGVLVWQPKSDLDTIGLTLGFSY